MVACQKKIYIPLENQIVSHDSIRQHTTSYFRDTIFISNREIIYGRDSVSTVVDTSGRVLGIDSWHFRDRIAEVKENSRSVEVSSDTLKDIRRDTLHVTVPVIVERNKEVPRQRTLPEKGLLLVGVLTVVYLFFRIFRKRI